jgi:hypothetical protein
MTPFFSVVIATFCRKELLLEAVQSVFAQTDSDFELIVSDDHSADETLEALRSIDDPRLKVVQPPKHVKATENWEFARSQATGTYLVFLSDVDALAPSMLKEVRSAIGTTGAEMVFTAFAEYLDKDFPGSGDLKSETLLIPSGRSRRVMKIRSIEYLSTLYSLRPYFAPRPTSYVVKRSLVESVARTFGGSFCRSQEMEFFCWPAAISVAKNALFLDEPLAIVRRTTRASFEKTTDETMSPERLEHIHHAWETDLINLPVRAHLVLSAMAEGIWMARSLDSSGRLRRFEEDHQTYAAQIAPLLAGQEKSGIDVSRELRELETFRASLGEPSRKLQALRILGKVSQQEIHARRRAKGYQRAISVDCKPDGKPKNITEALGLL